MGGTGFASHLRFACKECTGEASATRWPVVIPTGASPVEIRKHRGYYSLMPWLKVQLIQLIDQVVEFILLLYCRPVRGRVCRGSDLLSRVATSHA